jgi:hypothetical protein
MRSTASTSRMPFDSAATAVETEHTPSAGRWRIGRAYRAGRLVCGCVHVRVSLDERLGLTERERLMVRVRFHEPVDDALRAELSELARRRGTASHRAAERIAPIEIVVDDPRSEHERVVGSLQPPQRRYGQLREIEFGFRDSNGPDEQRAHRTPLW